MSISPIGGSRYSSTDWSTKPSRTAQEAPSSYEQVAAALSSPSTIPAAYDQSWMSKNLSAQDKATITATTGVRFGASGSLLMPMSASPNESYALQRTLHQLNSQRGGFPKELTPEEVLQLIKQNAPGANPESIDDFIKRTYSNGRTYA
ncbi:hypothetical protein ACUN7V_21120 [Quadrisphaera oryzae]|uniref:hypothetical protein n=1 Tax=Quadrisphaera TaxID=317661 RepID=UPI001646AD7B|nr:hypothetical protein [Quadrisphaera sp. RL12-1S]MBC3764226.1 hypothetical protein [Quadrisphaera sp. RL12-1S]